MADILVIDKDPQIRDKFSQITRRLGYSITSSASVPEAMAIIDKEKPSLVLLDVKTTENEDAVTVVKEIRQHSKDIEIIILSASDKHLVKEAFTGLGVWAVVKKSFFGDQMFKQILEILKGAEGGKELLSESEKQDILVMIVDDNFGVRETLKNFLKKKGYRAAPVASGDEAIEQIESGQPRPKIVLLDLRMPGTDGLAVLEKIKEIDPDIEVIILSSTHDPAVIREAKKLGATDYLTKPCDLGAVDSAVSLLFLKLLSR